MKRSTPKTTVHNLATGAEELYMLEPLEALISAAILADKRAGDLTNPLTRRNYAKRIIYGKVSASIGDLAVKI